MSNDGVAKLPQLPHATRRLSHGHVDGVTAVWHVEKLKEITLSQHPKFFGSAQTMPHRLMVAGDAYCKSKVSQIMQQWGCKRMRSPFGSVSSRLSSMTCVERQRHETASAHSRDV